MTTLEWKPDKRNGGSPLGPVYKDGEWDGYMGHGEALAYARRLRTKLKITGPLAAYAKRGGGVEKKCLHPECGKEPRGRGLCNAHYKQVRRLLKKGEADEVDLVKRGLLLPSTRVTPEEAAIFRKGAKETGRGVQKKKKATKKKATKKRTRKKAKS